MMICRSSLAGAFLVLLAFMSGCEYRLVSQVQYRVELSSPSSPDFVPDLEDGLRSIGFRSLSTIPADLELSVRSYALEDFRVDWFFENPGTLLVSCSEDSEQLSIRGNEICDEVGRVLRSLPAEVTRLEKSSNDLSRETQR
jgi:hypothetical protein